MTELCVVTKRDGVGNVSSSLSLQPVNEGSFESEVAASLSIPIANLSIPLWKGDCVDDVLANSRSAMLEGKRFDETDSFAFFQELARIGVRVVCWYAEYCDDLPVVRSANALMELARSAVNTEECELYCDAQIDVARRAP